jgi:hypothetical protein
MKRPGDVFVGRKIKRVQVMGVNQWRFHFEDGGYADVEVCSVMPTVGLFGLRIVKEDKKH